MHILVATLDAASNDKLETFLQRDGNNATFFSDGGKALEAWRSDEPDIAILDAALPTVSGIDILKEIRQTSFVPVILVSNAADELDAVIGLELGADDYVRLPCGARELAARVKAIKRRTESAKRWAMERSTGNRLEYGGLEIYTDCYEVYLSGKRVRLTPKETELLMILAQSPGKVFVRSTLINQIWGYDYVGETRIVDSLVRHLRAKLDSTGQPWNIATIYGVGYKFELDLR